MKLPTLSGVNFGGWLSQSDLSRQRLETFITENDFRLLQARGFNTVRVPFNAALLWQRGALLPEGLAWLDRAVAWAKAAGLIIILDLHETPGHSFVDMGANDIYGNPQQRKDAAALWTALARHYSGEGDRVLFELLNEPVAPDAGHWQSLAQQLTDAIRDQDERRPLVMGSNLWNTAGEFASLKPTGDPRTVYTFHFYDPVHFTHQGAPWVRWSTKLPPQPYPGEARGLETVLGKGDPAAEAQAGQTLGHWDAARLEGLLAPVIAFRDEHRVPVFCGEFGVYLNAPRADQLRWMEDFTGLLVKHGFGFTYWSHRDMDFGIFYGGAPWGHLPQYQNPDRMDAALMDLLARRAAELAAADARPVPAA